MPNHPVVHIEIPASDVSAAGTFYSEVFGWKTDRDNAYDYVQFQAEPGPRGGFVPVTAEGSDSPMPYKADSLLLYIGTDDIDASLAEIEKHGGKTVMPRTEIPHVGSYAVFTDPTGNRVGLFTGESSADKQS